MISHKRIKTPLPPAAFPVRVASALVFLCLLALLFIPSSSSSSSHSLPSHLLSLFSASPFAFSASPLPSPYFLLQLCPPSVSSSFPTAPLPAPSLSSFFWLPFSSALFSPNFLSRMPSPPFCFLPPLTLPSLPLLLLLCNLEENGLELGREGGRERAAECSFCVEIKEANTRSFLSSSSLVDVKQQGCWSRS